MQLDQEARKFMCDALKLALDIDNSAPYETYSDDTLETINEVISQLKPEASGQFTLVNK